MPVHIGVIGAGLAGLSAALHLIGAGHTVTVVEREPRPGGRCGTEPILGADGTEHRVDTGASVLTMPGLVIEALVAAGMSRADAETALDLLPVTPAYQGRFADGSTLAVPGELDAPEHLAWQHAMFETAYERFIAGDAAWHTFANPADLRRLASLVRLGALRSMQYQVERRVPDPRTRRMLTFQALYAGVSPARARAVYAVISHMDVGLGVVYPRGGMGAVAEVMAARVRAAGGTVLLNAEAIGLDGRRGAATGARVRSDGAISRIEFDGAVLTCDQPLTDRLIGPLGGRGPRRRVRSSPSAVVAHLNVPEASLERWPTSAHHTLDFGQAWEGTFAEITATGGRGEVMRDPSFLITRPSVTTESAAPVSVLAPCPNLESAPIDWDRVGPDYLRHILHTLRRRGYAGIDTAELLRCDTPADWSRRGMSAGTPFAAAHTLTQTGPLRRPARVPGLANVVLAGSLTHPGVGVPPALLSGRIAASVLAG